MRRGPNGGIGAVCGGLARALLADPASDRAEIEQIARRGETLIDANAMGQYRTDLDEIVAQLAATHESETLA